MTEPIIVDCEGSGCPTHRFTPWAPTGMCAMCGHQVELAADGLAVPHQRQDLLAMIERGDFDA